MNNNAICPMCQTNGNVIHLVTIRHGWGVVKCQFCQGYYATPMGIKQETNALGFYDEREYLVGQYLSWGHIDFIKYRPQGSTLLDIGCGTGDFINLAVKQGYDAVGIDLDKRAVEAGNKHWGFDRLHYAEAESFMTSQNKQWGIITLFAVLEHLVDPNILFGEVVKHIKPNGIVVVLVQNIDTFYAHLWATVTKGNDYPPNHFTRWSRKSLSLFLERYNMKERFRSTCPASIMDNVPDIAINYIHNKTMLKFAMRLVGWSMLAMTPIELFLNKFGGEGRAQMVIAQKII